MRPFKKVGAARAKFPVFVVLFLAFIAGACGDRKSDEQTSQPAAEAPKATVPPATPPRPDRPEQAAPDQASKPASEPPRQTPAPLAPPSEAPKPDTTLPRTTPTEQPKPTPATTVPPQPAQKPAPPEKVAAKDVVVLAGSALGAVRLQHKAHAERGGGACTTCHHPSKPEKPASAPQQACSDCHTKTATPPMKTKLQGAFHNPTAQSGTCIGCHEAENAKGKKAPVKCNECHKKPGARP